MRSPQQREEAEQQQEAFLQRSAQQLPTNSGWGVPQQHPKVLVAKNWVEELHEFVDEKHNVHKDIKELVLKIRRALGSAVKEWTNVLQRAEIAESELASTKNALADKTLPQQTPRTVPGNLGKKEKLARTENTPMSATKRHRSSPGDERPGGSKRQRDNLRKRLAAAEAEQVGVGNRETQWQTVQRKGKAKQTNAGARPKAIRRSVKKKGEAIVLKTREESYLEVLRTIRTAPELKDFGADQLLCQSTKEAKCDVAIISDPYRIPSGNGNWVADEAGTAAIWTVGRSPLQEVVYRAIEGFVIAKVNGVYICSCYSPPRWTIERFNQVLDRILEKLGDRRPVIIAGDFNAWAVEWGSRLTNPRGWSLLETVSRLNLVLANEGSTSTYRREGRESIIDVTFCSPTVVRSMNWRVCEDYTHSDHQAFRYRLGERVQTAARGDDSKGRKWRTEAFDEDVFAEVLRLRYNYAEEDTAAGRPPTSLLVEWEDRRTPSELSSS
ncbi:uncharacterized protein LOC134290593 [Aedes albopictus]|uniref:Endonuclease/exonuclease/phosphatase domain-containing protein n=1 Tax=Aedes albopictus TaxID=7160 RepID=A0ABM1XSC6_AEDAL